VTTDEVLAILGDRGLTVVVSEQGGPSLKGDRSGASEKLLRVLAQPCHREEIVRRFRPKPGRRIVLLAGGGDSAAERVLEECPPQGHHGRVRHWAQQLPGRTVAAEWLQGGYAGERWARFLFMRWPPPEEGDQT
jgi:hypothetical protein